MSMSNKQKSRTRNRKLRQKLLINKHSDFLCKMLNCNKAQLSRIRSERLTANNILMDIILTGKVYWV